MGSAHPIRRSLSVDLNGLQSLIDTALEGKGAIRVLEAGCGSGSHLRMPQQAHITGIDISAKQLQRNALVHERIQGDIQTHPLEPGSFDLAVCWDVLEHLPHPELACQNLWSGLRPGGQLVLAFPNRESVKGLLTRLTPIQFHVWTYRHLFGRKDAGSDDVGPFPTYLRPAIAPKAIVRFAEERGGKVEMLQLFESPMQTRFMERHGVLGRVYRTTSWGVQRLTLGRISARLTDCIVVLRKNPR